MRLDLHDGFHLSPVREGDQSAYVEHFADKETTDWMLVIPFPYTHQDAEDWVRLRLESACAEKPENQFAIRRADGFLIGGIGLMLNGPRSAHRAEVGYWLACPYRQHGVMTAAVKAVTHYGFEHLGLTRIEATTFTGNQASQRVLEKAGFVLEGILRGYHRKNGEPVDACMYACLAAEINKTSA